MHPEPLVRRLLSPEAYPHPVDAVRLVETHISWVFLTGRTAYKVKKPVNLGFLDFSTVEKRRHFCHEEVRLNGRFAPEIYQAAVPITGSATDARVQGEGRATEWAVRLTQFDEDDRLDRVLEAGGLSAGDTDRLARDIADVQERLEVSDHDTPWGTCETVADTIGMNLDQLRTHRGERRDRVDALQEWVHRAIDARREAFAQRRAAGRVRQCHGDLHLANLVCHADRFLAFDSIEFSEVLRWIDVASDVAFLAMDLMSRNRHDLAATVTNSWIEASGDHDATAILPIYLVYRAIVRSAIAAIRGSQPSAEVAAAHAESDRYLALAEHLATLRTPTLVATCGVSGCGKTTLARALVASTGAVQLRSDVERKRLFGMAPTDRSTSAEHSDALYSATATQQTYERLAALAGHMLANGANVVIDAACTRRWQRDLIAKAAANAGVSLTWLSPQVSERELIARVEARCVAGMDASDASADIVRAQLVSFEPITAAELAGPPTARMVHCVAECEGVPPNCLGSRGPAAPP